MHNIFPQTEDWSFSPVRSDVDEDIFQSYIWSPTATTTNATGGPGSVSVFVQPPWILSPKDLHAFSRCDTVSHSIFTYYMMFSGFDGFRYVARVIWRR